MALEPPPFDPLVSSDEITITPAHQSGGTQRFVEEDCGQAGKEEKSRYLNLIGAAYLRSNGL